MSVILSEHQREALKNMHNGCILCGGVGSGKTRTALAYYHCIIGGGRVRPHFEPMTSPVDLYVITTAATRDKLGWEREMIPFLLFDAKSEKVADSGDKKQLSGDCEKLYSTSVTVDSWNNIGKYAGVENAFFIFDEQRVTGNGPWVKAFLKITKHNQWILLSATPGDTWSDYIPVFIANGFYKNRTEFNTKHVGFKRVGTYWKVDRYFETRKLERLRDRILVDMEVERDREVHHIDIFCTYDRGKYREIQKLRWDPWKNEPIENAAGLCYALRKVVNEDVSRLNGVLEVIHDHPKAIIFYNFDYELELLKKTLEGYSVAEWNGHKHQEIPEGNKWYYLVQYGASEGWNCIKTDTVIFYSQNYSYKVMTQAAGRIDRLNTPFMDLYYYHLKSKAPIDIAINRAVRAKKTFNEGRYYNRMFKEDLK